VSAAGRFGTCPATCALLPADAAGMALKIDEAYALEIARSRPRRGCGWIYTHFAADLWRDLRSRVGTVFNLSADTPIEAAAAVRAGIDAVVTVAESWWQGKRVREVEGVPVMRCPEETGHVTGCLDCGGGAGPICAQAGRKFVVGFSLHGPGARREICYANYGPVSWWWDAVEGWRGLLFRGRKVFGCHATYRNGRAGAGVDHAELVREWVRSIPRNAYVRHHISGDLGLI